MHYIPSRYNPPVSVDLSPELRAATYRQKRVNAATSHARWAAKAYSRVLVRQQETIHGYNAVEGAGGELGIAKTMATYNVYEPLRVFAARVCMRLVRERLAR